MGDLLWSAIEWLLEALGSDALESFLRTLGNWSYWASLAGANLFVLLYGTLARWWRTEMGLNLFSFMLVIALVLDHALLFRIVGDYPGRDAVRAILNVAAAGIVWWRVAIFVRVQIERRFRRSENHADDAER